MLAPDHAVPNGPPRGRIRKIGAALAAITFLAVAPSAYARTGAPDGFADLAAQVTPAVVNVSTVGTRKVSAQEERDSPRQGRGSRTERVRALGSGFIIDPAGYVVTNNHVIDGASEVTVTLPDGRKFPAKLVGRDSKTDLALLKIASDGKLPSVEFGDSDKARVGDWVMAVGNPFGLGGTVTAGIVSARNRDIQSGPFDDYLQIDAPINKGNSGGPLFGMDGKVIGINTAIYSPSGGSIGIGFAIPASIAKPVIAQLRAHGRIERGWLGVSIQPVTDELAKALGLPKPEGALVAQIEPGSPAANAGLRVGDVILSVNGKSIENTHDLLRLVASLAHDAKAELGVLRNEKPMMLTARIGEQPSGSEAMAEPVQADRGSGHPLSYGLVLGPLTPKERELVGRADSIGGVRIARVQPGSPAAEAGLGAGDVILRIGNKEVSDLAKARDALEAAKLQKKPVAILIAHGNETRFVALQAGEI